MTFSPGTNFYFNNWKATGEQNLIESLIIESIKIYGMDMMYLPRRYGNLDPIYTEDSASFYNRAYPIEFYIKSVDGFQGEGDFLSKFGVEIRDRVTFTVARRIWSKEVGSNENNMPRPFEGDLIYFPLNRKIFKIMFVEHEAIFYQLGALQTYDLVCELFEYSNETFNTGIPDIDGLTKKYEFDYTNVGLHTEAGDMLIDENEGIPILFEEFDINSSILDENDMFQEKGLEILNFSEIDPFAEGGRY
jgi:hypothetical protein